MLKFLLNDSLQTVNKIDPNISVLEYLREHVFRTGTKEGCASGDCGACTVVVAELLGEALCYQSINACITPIGTLHGKQLITVEDLKYQGQLHPVQQSMVECHGSQCGFCTPGFVMSMFAFYKNNLKATRETINEAFSGNLCRCTGYSSIINAIQHASHDSLSDQFSKKQQQTVACLKSIGEEKNTVTLQANGKQFFSPVCINDLSLLLEIYPNARLLAGGTDLSLDITQGLQDVDLMIYIGRVDELLQINEDDSCLEIGAAVSYSQCSDVLVKNFPDLLELLTRLGSRQIRNQGTLAGNVANASPIADMPPVLMVLNAKLSLRCGQNTRVLNVSDYYQSYKVTALQRSEFIEKIIIPKARKNDEFRVYKISKRLDDDISSTCAAFNIQIVNGVVENALIALGGMADIPKRARHCEQALLQQAWNEKTMTNAMREMAKDFKPISDFRASAQYRLLVSQHCLRRFFLELESRADQVRVTRYA